MSGRYRNKYGVLKWFKVRCSKEINRTAHISSELKKTLVSDYYYKKSKIVRPVARENGKLPLRAESEKNNSV